MRRQQRAAQRSKEPRFCPACDVADEGRCPPPFATVHVDKCSIVKERKGASARCQPAIITAFRREGDRRGRTDMPDTMSDTTKRSDQSTNAKPDLGAAVTEIKTALTGKAEELAGRSAESGAAAVSALGKTAATLAGSSGRPVAGRRRLCCARLFSASTRLADDLRDKSAGELLTIATDFGKRQPLALLAGSAIVDLPSPASSRRVLAPRRKRPDRGRTSPMSAGSTPRSPA